MTLFPARASVYAVVRPAIPAPTMHTSHSASAASGGNDGISAVAIHAEMVVPESVFGWVMVDRGVWSMVDLCNSRAGNTGQALVGRRVWRVYVRQTFGRCHPEELVVIPRSGAAATRDLVCGARSRPARDAT